MRAAVQRYASGDLTSSAEPASQPAAPAARQGTPALVTATGAGEPSPGVMCMGPGCLERNTSRYGLRRMPLCPACRAALEGRTHQRETPQTPGALAVAVAAGAETYMNPVTGSTYLAGPYGPGASTCTISAAVSTAGSTTFTISSTVPAVFPAGTSFLIGNAATSRELLVVSNTSALSVITSTTASIYDHAASSTVSTVVFSPVQAHITTGTI